MSIITTKFRLYAIFSLLIGLMVFLIILGIASARLINERINVIVLEHNKKTELLTTMLGSARERTVILHEYLLIDDPFVRDEQMLKLDVYGAKFANARLQLVQMELEPTEKQVLDNQGRFTGLAIPLQRAVISLAAENKMQEAQKILIEQAVPAQDAVLTELDKLITLVSKSSLEASKVANASVQETKFIMILIGGFAILLSIVLAGFITKKICRVQEDLFQEKEKAITTLSSIGDGVITTNHLEIIEAINHSAEHILGISSTTAVGKPVNDILKLYDEDSLKPIKNPISLCLSQNKTSEAIQDPVLKRHDEYIPIESHASPIRTGNGNIIGAVLVFRDVTKSRAYAREIEYQATHDPLTGLINRREFDNHLGKVLERMAEPEARHVLMFLDLDKFKQINDALGHAAGDKLLQQLTRLMGKSLRQRDFLSRRGGDEFAVLLENCDAEKGNQIAEKLLDTVNNYSLQWEGEEYKVGVSIGLTMLSADDKSVDAVLDRADIACYQAKHKGRNRIEIYTSEIEITNAQPAYSS